MFIDQDHGNLIISSNSEITRGISKFSNFHQQRKVKISWISNEDL